jgi:hypothetical protein
MEAPETTKTSSTRVGIIVAFLGAIFGVILWLLFSFVEWDFSMSAVTIRLILVLSVLCGVIAKFLTLYDELTKPK